MRRQSTKLVLIGVFAAALMITARLVYEFLAVSKPLGQDMLVVDAAVPTELLAQVPALFRSGRYRCLVVVGHREGESRGDSPADVAGTELEKLGCPASAVVKITVPFQSTRRSYFIPVLVPPYCWVFVRIQLTRRTFADALAFRDWLRSSGVAAGDIDVFTVSVHARKNWILFQHAVGGKHRVGIIAAPQKAFNSRNWLLSREGIWLVPRNLGGYLYAKCLIFLDR
jgi:hypothetical protein